MKLSIVMPALNEAAAIAPTLSSLGPLRERGHEVIVHTDAYTESARVVEQVAGCEAVLLTQQRVPVTRGTIALRARCPVDAAAHWV